MKKLEDQEKGGKCILMYITIREQKVKHKSWTLSATFFKDN